MSYWIRYVARVLFAAIEQAQLVDIAPTLAALLGQSLPEADGHVLSELLK